MLIILIRILPTIRWTLWISAILFCTDNNIFSFSFVCLNPQQAIMKFAPQKNIPFSYLPVLFAVFFLNITAVFAQTKSSTVDLKLPLREFVASYSIVVKGRKIDGIAESYNGGVKVAFVQNDKVRLRLVSLMRTQSIFFNNKKGITSKVSAVVKESGKEKARFYLNNKEWKIYNQKYDSTTCEIFKDDTLRILGKLCSKATVTTKKGSSVTVYYYPGIKNNALAAAEPIFSCIPGFVMKYIYTVGDKSIEYTITSVSRKPIAASVFNIPVKGYKLQKYRPGTTNINVDDLNNDGVDDMTDEEEMED